MQEALQVLVGPEAQGLSANTISRLKRQWGAAPHDAAVFSQLDLATGGIANDQENIFA